jgi:mono/diheme cytochrome c family protein
MSSSRPVFARGARPLAGLIAVAAVAALLAACGSGSGSGSGSTGGSRVSATSGERIFASVGCASCHTLAAAGSGGQVGPNLDHIDDDVAAIERQVRHGGGGMPAFAGQLSDAQIRAVAQYVFRVSKHD